MLSRYSTTSEESENALARLESMLKQILQSNVELSERITNIKTSILQSYDDLSTIRTYPEPSENASIVASVRDADGDNAEPSKLQNQPQFGLDPDVEDSLFTSFVYVRNGRRHSMSSLPSLGD